MTVKAWGESGRNFRKYLKLPHLKQHLLNPYLWTALFSMGLWQLGAWTTLELLGFNILFNTRNYLPHATWDQRIAVIAIDDVTLREYGQFPLSRDRYTQLLETLAASSPAAIGFDILFTEPTTDDAALAEAMEINGQVVLAVAPSLQQKTLRPVPDLDSVTTKGHIVSNANIDGVTRQSYLYINRIPSLSIQLVAAYNNSLQQTFTPNTHNCTKFLAVIPPVQSGVKLQSALINWIAPTHQILTYSFIDVIQKKINTAKLLDAK